MSHFVGIGLVLGFLLPHSSTALLLVNPLLCLFYKCFKQNRGFYKYNWIVFVPIIVSLLINLPQEISTKSALLTLTILLYFFCFPIVGKVKVPNAYFYILLGVIFATQIAYAYNITFIERFLNTYYPLSEEDKAVLYQQEHITVDTILNYRLGGLYHNSNQCARYLTFLLTAFVIFNSEKSYKKLLPFVAVSYYAILLTGSRTGFVVASLGIIAYFFVEKRVSSLWRTIVIVAFIAVFLVLTFSGSNTFRGFNVIGGFGNSASLKMNTFAYYLFSENSVIRILIGYLDFLRFDISGASDYVMKKFDADYGYLIFQYGFVGFIAILLYFFSLFRRVDINKKLFFILFLWMFSSTIVTSFRAFFIFMLLLSVIYSNNGNMNIDK